MAANDGTPKAGMPQGGVLVTKIDGGEIRAVDIRLPAAANALGVTPDGTHVPFSHLHVLVDGHNQIAETTKDNNGAVLARTDILPVDPAAFSTDLTAAAPGGTLNIAGEGFGPEGGQLVVLAGGQQLQAEIQGWFDLGVRFTIPAFVLKGSTDAEILVVRGDGAVANPLHVQLAPAALLSAAPAGNDAPVPTPMP